MSTLTNNSEQKSGLLRLRWSKKHRRYVILFLTLALTGVVALNILAYRHAYAMMHFAKGGLRTGSPESLSFRQKLTVLLCGTEIPRPQSTLSPAVLGPECQSLTISVTNKVSLGAWYCSKIPQSPLVILFHGYTGEKTGTLHQAKAFREMGCSVLLVDFRGSGASSESYTTFGYLEGEDVAAAVRYAKNHLNYSRIILFGQSMGAAAVLRAVHSCQVQPDAIILEAVFDQMLNTVGHRFNAMGLPSFPGAQLLLLWGGYQAGFNAFTHNPVDYATQVHCPILFLHGAVDPRARLEDGRRVFNAVPGPKHFHEFPNIGHEAPIVRFHDKWFQLVSTFLQETTPLTNAPTAQLFHFRTQ